MCSSSKGRKPLRRAYSSIPRLHTSALGPLYFSPWMSSGRGGRGGRGGERRGREGIKGNRGEGRGGEGRCRMVKGARKGRRQWRRSK